MDARAIPLEDDGGVHEVKVILGAARDGYLAGDVTRHNGAA